MQLRGTLPLLVLVTLCTTRPAIGDSYTLGPYTFDEHAFADQSLQVSGPVWEQSNPTWMLEWSFCAGGIPRFQGFFTEHYLLAYGLVDPLPDQVFELQFTNNAILNSAGPDIAIYEMALYQPAGTYLIGVSDGNGGFTELEATGTTPSLLDRWAYSICGQKASPTTHYNVYLVTIDLSDLGIANGVLIDALRFSTPDGADPIVIAPIHSQGTVRTEPTTWGRVKSLYR